MGDEFGASANAYLSGPDIGSFFYQPYVAGKRAIQDFANSLRAWFSAIGLEAGVGAVNPSEHSDRSRRWHPGDLHRIGGRVGQSGVGHIAAEHLSSPRARSDATGQHASVVARAFRQQLELTSPYPNVFAVIPDGPYSTAEAATLPLMLATREKEEQQFGEMPWAKK